jgi:hypothetical protein
MQKIWVHLKIFFTKNRGSVSNMSTNPSLSIFVTNVHGHGSHLLRFGPWALRAMWMYDLDE